MDAIVSRATQYLTGEEAATLALLIIIWIATNGNVPA
jgi:hypothetical protein